MRCSKCGTENKEHAQYCKRCGAPVHGNHTEDRRRTRIIAIALALAVVAFCITVITVYGNHQQKAEYNGKLQLADKYLQELDYERAETAYLEAIKIQPKKEEAYIKLADLYTGQGKYKEALEILKKGKKQSQGKEIERKLKSEELNLPGSCYEPILSQYRDLIEHNYYRDKDESESMESPVGKNVNPELLGNVRYEDNYRVYYALKDIDQNGVQEMLIGLGSSLKEVRQYDIFSLSEGGPVSLFPDEQFGYRTNFEVYTDGTIEISRSGSAIDHAYEFYRISDNGYTTDLLESIAVFGTWQESGEEPLIKYYHDSEGKQEISEAEFNKRKDSYESKEKETFDWVLLEEAQQSTAQRAEAYQAYYDLCMEYQEKYGAGAIGQSEGFEDFTISVLKGLYAVQLIDFNGDNNPELLLGYYEEPVEPDDPGYIYEIWAWDNGKLKQVLEKQPANHIEGIAWMETTCEAGQVYMVKDHRMEATTGSAVYLAYDGGNFYTKYDIVLPDSEAGKPGSINGERKAGDEVIRLHNKLARPYYPKAGGDLITGYQNEKNQRIFFPLNSDWHVYTTQEQIEDFHKVLQDTQNNLEILKAG